MKLFVITKLLFYFPIITAAINGTKKKRKSAGLIFSRLEYSKSICMQLGCKDGMGYTGTGEDECYSVSRCLKCKVTSASFHSQYCSEIPTLQGELTIFQGSFINTGTGVENLKQISSNNDYSDLSEDDNFKTGDSGSSQEVDDEVDDEAGDDVDESDTNDNSSYYTNEKEKLAVSSSTKSSMNGYSLLELVSQMTESEVEEDVGGINNKANNNTKRSKGLLSRIFSKKKKSNPYNKTQAATFKKASRFSFNMNNFKNKFRNKSGTNKMDSGSEEINTIETAKETRVSTAKISKGNTLELKPNGHLMSERLNKCIVS